MVLKNVTVDADLIIKRVPLWDSLAEPLGFLYLPVSCHWVPQVVMLRHVPWSWHCHPWQSKASCNIFHRKFDFYIWTTSRLRTLSLVHPGASANGLTMQPQTSFQPPSMVWCAIWPLAAWTYVLDHTCMGACVHISLPALLLMCLLSGAAEHLRKVPHCQMVLLVSGSYLRFILSTLSWIVEKEQKTGLISF